MLSLNPGSSSTSFLPSLPLFYPVNLLHFTVHLLLKVFPAGGNVTNRRSLAKSWLTFLSCKEKPFLHPESTTPREIGYRRSFPICRQVYFKCRLRVAFRVWWDVSVQWKTKTKRLKESSFWSKYKHCSRNRGHPIIHLKRHPILYFRKSLKSILEEWEVNSETGNDQITTVRVI